MLRPTNLTACESDAERAQFTCVAIIFISATQSRRTRPHRTRKHTHTRSNHIQHRLSLVCFFSIYKEVCSGVCGFPIQVQTHTHTHSHSCVRWHEVALALNLSYQATGIHFAIRSRAKRMLGCMHACVACVARDSRNRRRRWCRRGGAGGSAGNGFHTHVAKSIAVCPLARSLARSPARIGREIQTHVN